MLMKRKKKKKKKREAQLVTEVNECRLLVVFRAKGRRTEGGRGVKSSVLLSKRSQPGDNGAAGQSDAGMKVIGGR